MTVVCAHGRLGCANHRERGTCGNGRTILRGCGARLREMVEQLEGSLACVQTRAIAADRLRSIIDKILVHPVPGCGQTEMELRVGLAAFLYLQRSTQGVGSHGPSETMGADAGDFDVRRSLVAGVGFEPTTFRL